MTRWHKTGAHPFYIGMYIHIYTHIYVHIYTSQKECLHIFTSIPCSASNSQVALPFPQILHSFLVHEKSRCFAQSGMPQAQDLQSATGPPLSRYSNIQSALEALFVRQGPPVAPKGKGKGKDTETLWEAFKLVAKL